MTTAQVVSLVAAACVAAWSLREHIEYAVGLLFSDDHNHTPAARRGPSYQQSMIFLANVRLRLVETSALSKDAAAAVETLTLALMAGSDK